ncbi:MAG: DsbA family protein [Candidatus Aenigmarchaeota archaeon]|nr:DsbA family protein [Candidatus Aenigmarchaeota archaeon]
MNLMEDDMVTFTVKKQHLVVVAALAVVFVMGFFSGSYFSGSSAAAGATGNVLGNTGGTLPQYPTTTLGPVQLDTSGAALKGDQNAKVSLVIFEDFQCPFCERFTSDALVKIEKDYVDTGKVKLFFKHFPLTQIHPYAQKASEAAACAQDQGKFWEYHDVLFKNQDKLGVDDLKKYAADMGLNTATFNSCLDSGTKKNQVEKDASDGDTAGVTGTPTIFVNGKPIVGAQPYAAFKAAIDAELAKA